MDKFKRLSKILNIAGYITVGLLAVFIVFMIISNARGQIAFIGNHTVIWIRTPSMEPTIPGRSYILVEKITADEVGVDDVIVFRSDDPEIEGLFNTHRVVEIVGDHEEFVTKGDGNHAADSINAKAESVCGRFIKNLPVMSVFGRVLSSAMGIIISVTALFALFSAFAIPTMIRSINEKSNELETEKEALIEEMIRAEVEKLKAAEKQHDGDSGDSGGQ